MSAALQIQPYHARHREAWNALVTQAKNATFLFHRDYLEYHADRFEEASLTVWRDQELVGLLPAHRVGEAAYSHEGLSYGGLAMHRETKFPHYMEAFSGVLLYLQGQGISTLHYNRIPRLYTQQGAEELDYILYLVEAKLTQRKMGQARWQADPLPTQKRRVRAVAKAQAAGVELKEAEGFDEFWEQVLIPHLADRHGVAPVHSAEEIDQLKRNFPQHIRQFNAYVGETLVAGTTLFVTPTVAHVQYISSLPEGRKNGALDFLFTWLIEEEFAGKVYFDFGTVNEEGGQKINRGLLDWKEGFGARTFVYDRYAIATASYSLLEGRYL